MTGMTVDAEFRMGSLVGTGMIELHSAPCISTVTTANVQSSPTATIFVEALEDLS